VGKDAEVTTVPVDREDFDQVMGWAREIVSIQANPERRGNLEVSAAAAGIWFKMRHILRKAGMLEESEEARAYAMNAEKEHATDG
jgi:hypothetical protein